MENGSTYDRIKKYYDKLILEDYEIQCILNQKSTMKAIDDYVEISQRVGKYVADAIIQVLTEDEGNDNTLQEIIDESLLLITLDMYDCMVQLDEAVQSKQNWSFGNRSKNWKPDFPIDEILALREELIQLLDIDFKPEVDEEMLHQSWKIVKKYTNKDNLSDEEDFLFSEAMDYIVNNSPKDIHIAAYNFGSYYMEIERYDMALKYFMISANTGSAMACSEIGIIYYYGLSGQIDYKKAYQYLRIAENMHWKNGSYLIADMYRYGLYLEQDYNKYDDIISDLFDWAEEDTNSFHSIPEIFFREAEIIVSSGSSEAMVAGKNMLLYAEEVIKDRIFRKKRKRINRLDIQTLRDIQDILYVEILQEAWIKDIFDLDLSGRHGINKGIVVEYKNKKYSIAIEQEEDGSYSIGFLGKWYRNMADFIERAILDNHTMCALYEQLKVVETF